MPWPRAVALLNFRHGGLKPFKMVEPAGNNIGRIC